MVPACCVFVARAIGSEVAAAQLALLRCSLGFYEASMANSMAIRYRICYLEPLLACILTCIHAALAHTSKIKGHDYIFAVLRH